MPHLLLLTAHCNALCPLRPYLPHPEEEFALVIYILTWSPLCKTGGIPLGHRGSSFPSLHYSNAYVQVSYSSLRTIIRKRRGKIGSWVWTRLQQPLGVQKVTIPDLQRCLQAPVVQQRTCLCKLCLQPIRPLLFWLIIIRKSQLFALPKSTQLSICKGCPLTVPFYCSYWAGSPPGVTPMELSPPVRLSQQWPFVKCVDWAIIRDSYSLTSEVALVIGKENLEAEPRGHKNGQKRRPPPTTAELKLSCFWFRLNSFQRNWTVLSAQATPEAYIFGITCPFNLWILLFYIYSTC